MSERRKINPAVDIVFKAIFGAEERKPLLMDLLNCLFSQLQLPLIKKITIQNPYSGKERLFDKEIILDIRITDQEDRVIQVEMQSNPYAHIQKRMIYNNATILSKTLSEGDNYYSVKEVISIWILGDNLDKKEEGIDLIELKSRLGREDFDLQKIIVIESEKLRSTDDRIGKWMYIINRWKDYSVDNPPQWMEKDKQFMEVLKVVDIFSMNDEEFDYYLARKNYQMDVSLREMAGFEKGHKQGLEEGIEQGVKQGLEQGIEQGVKQGLEKGLEQGVKQGLEEGIEQGVKQGLEQGQKKAHTAKLAIVHRMLDSGFLDSQIASITNDSIAVIQELIGEIKKNQ